MSEEPQDATPDCPPATAGYSQVVRDDGRDPPISGALDFSITSDQRSMTAADAGHPESNVRLTVGPSNLDTLVKNGEGGLFGEFTEQLLGTNAIDPNADNAIVGDVSPALGITGTLVMTEESMRTMRATIRLQPHPHSTEGRLEALERRFERLLQTLEIMTYNHGADGNWNHFRDLTTGESLGCGFDRPNAHTEISKQLTGFQNAMKEMREGSVYLRLYPEPFDPQHWNDGL